MHYKSKIEQEADGNTQDTPLTYAILGVIAFIVLLPIIIPLFIVAALIRHTFGIAIKEF